MFSKNESGAKWVGGTTTAGMFVAAIVYLVGSGIPPLEEGRAGAILLFTVWAFFLWASISTETRTTGLCTKIAGGVGLLCGIAAALLAHDIESIVLGTGALCAVLSLAICFSSVLSAEPPEAVYFLWRVAVTYTLGFELPLMIFTNLSTAVLALGSFAPGMLLILMVAAARGLNSAAPQIEKRPAAPEPEAEGEDSPADSAAEDPETAEEQSKAHRHEFDFGGPGSRKMSAGQTAAGTKYVGVAMTSRELGEDPAPTAEDVEDETPTETGDTIVKEPLEEETQDGDPSEDAQS